MKTGLDVSCICYASPVTHNSLAHWEDQISQFMGLSAWGGRPRCGVISSPSGKSKLKLDRWIICLSRVVSPDMEGTSIEIDGLAPLQIEKD